MSLLTERLIPAVRFRGRKIQRGLDKILIRLSEPEHPGFAGRVALSSAFRARLALVLALEGLEGRAEFWSGAERETGRPLKVLYLADGRAYKVGSPQYLQHILFQPESFTVTEGERFSMTAVRERAQALAAQAGLVLVEGNDLLRWQPESGMWMQSPTWARMVFHYHPGEPWEETEKRMRRQKNNLRRMRQSDFEFTASHSDADFDYFYDHMHVPMMEGRHAGYGHVDNKESMRRLFHEGALFLVLHEGQRVAGGLVHFKGRSAFGIANGVVHGNAYWYDQGAVTLLYYETLRWFHTVGFASYDFGGVRPFQSDGLYQYKSRWGLTAEADLWLGRSWLFWSPAGDPAADGWLRANPIIEVQGAAAAPALAGLQSAGKEGADQSNPPAVHPPPSPTGRLQRPLRRGLRRAQHHMDALLVRLSADPQPGALKQAAGAAVENARLRLLLALEGEQGQAELWQGDEKESGAPLRVAFIGDERAYKGHSDGYLRRLFFRPGEKCRPLGAVAMRRSGEAAQNLAPLADLVVVERSRLLNWLPPAHEAWRLTPTWVRMAVTFRQGEAWEALEARMEGHQNNIRRFRKAGFRCRESVSEADFDLFYERMHVPLVTSRHGEATDLESREAMLESFRKGGLLLFADTPDGQTVAGKLLYRRGGVVYVYAAGTLDGDKRWHNQGALSALTYHEIWWAYHNGVRLLDCGSVRPFTTDGNYLFKLRWGIQPIHDPWVARDWLFWAPGRTPAALRWLRAHPLIREKASGKDEEEAAPARPPTAAPIPVTAQAPEDERER
jgi:hypothetical protein